MKKFTFGMVWQVSGEVTVEVPDDIDNVYDAQDWVEDNWEDIPIPDNGAYIQGSESADFTGSVLLPAPSKNKE